jgi:hypothetical protein
MPLSAAQIIVKVCRPRMTTAPCFSRTDLMSLRTKVGDSAFKYVTHSHEQVFAEPNPPREIGSSGPASDPIAFRNTSGSVGGFILNSAMCFL